VVCGEGVSEWGSEYVEGVEGVEGERVCGYGVGCGGGVGVWRWSGCVEGEWVCGGGVCVWSGVWRGSAGGNIEPPS